MALAPQAIIKVIRNGGSHSPSQMKAQLDYIGRKETVAAVANGAPAHAVYSAPLRAHNSAMGADLQPDDAAEVALNWALGTGKYSDGRNSDIAMTTHIVVSFPPGTDHNDAEAAGREWAERMFRPRDNGEFGDDDYYNSYPLNGDEDHDKFYEKQNYRYFSALHTDRDHPHLHLVVDRRGDAGGWLKISARHPVLNYVNMREQMVTVARHHGIELDASSRSERGLGDVRPLTDVQIRLSQRARIQIMPDLHRYPRDDEYDRSIDSESDGTVDYDVDSIDNYDDYSAGVTQAFERAMGYERRNAARERDVANANNDPLIGMEINAAAPPAGLQGEALAQFLLDHPHIAANIAADAADARDLGIGDENRGRAADNPPEGQPPAQRQRGENVEPMQADIGADINDAAEGAVNPRRRKRGQDGFTATGKSEIDVAHVDDGLADETPRAQRRRRHNEAVHNAIVPSVIEGAPLIGDGVTAPRRNPRRAVRDQNRDNEE
jgi:hypothetical protein